MLGPEGPKHMNLASSGTANLPVHARSGIRVSDRTDRFIGSPCVPCRFALGHGFTYKVRFWPPRTTASPGDSAATPEKFPAAHATPAGLPYTAKRFVSDFEISVTAYREPSIDVGPRQDALWRSRSGLLHRGQVGKLCSADAGVVRRRVYTCLVEEPRSIPSPEEDLASLNCSGRRPTTSII